MRFAALVLAVVIAGCAHTHTSVNAAAGSASGTTTTGGSVSVHGHSHSLAALVIAGLFIAAAADYSSEPYPPPRFSDFADWFRGTPPPPEMDASRRISEQDCSKPVDESAGNLRCK
jgi:hypothetical protein